MQVSEAKTPWGGLTLEGHQLKLGQAVAIVGAEGLADLYARALRQLGVTATVAQGKSMALMGLATARAQEKERTA